MLLSDNKRRKILRLNIPFKNDGGGYIVVALKDYNIDEIESVYLKGLFKNFKIQFTYELDSKRLILESVNRHIICDHIEINFYSKCEYRDIAINSILEEDYI